MRFVALAVAAVCCTGCIIQNTVIADTVGVKGDVNNQVESVAVSPALGQTRATVPPQPPIGVIGPPTMMPPRSQVCDRDGPAAPAEAGRFELGAYAYKWIPNGWNLAYKSEADVTAAIKNQESKDTWACWQKFYPDATAVYLSIKDRPVATPVWQDVPVKVPVYDLPVRDVQVTQASLVILINRSQKVMATVRYADGSSDGNVMLSSDDGTIVSINPTTGEIIGLKPGTATVRVSSANDPSRFAVVQVTVREGEVEDLFATINPAKATVGVRNALQLTAEVQDGNAKVSSNGRWISSNPQIASVNSLGIVTGLKDGVVTITFTSDLRSTVRATAEVTVGDPTAAAPGEQTSEQTTVSTTTVTTETATSTQ